MKLIAKNTLLSVCKLSKMPDLSDTAFFALTQTDNEISLVCPARSAPADCLAREDGWRAFCVSGPLDFSLVGILNGLTSVLAARGIPVFAISTYDTDYLLIKENRFAEAASALADAGYQWEREVTE